MRDSRRAVIVFNITAAVVLLVALVVFLSGGQGEPATTTAGPNGTAGRAPLGTGTWPPGSGDPFGPAPGSTVDGTTPEGSAAPPASTAELPVSTTPMAPRAGPDLPVATTDGPFARGPRATNAVTVPGGGTTAPPASTTTTSVSTTQPPPPPGSHPNVLVVMTDDQTLETLRVMPNVRRYLGAEGTTFSNFFVSFPVCCPSRATYLTGQFSHNDNVRDNILPLGGFTMLDGRETLPVWLHRYGYYTASIGKYLNGWGVPGISGIDPPLGWSHWFGLIDPTTYRYKGYAVSNDGVRHDYGTTEADYQTDVLGQEVVNTIKAGQASKRPWYISFTPLAPHATEPEKSSDAARPSFADIHPYGPARYASATTAEEPPRTASFAQKDLSGLPADMQQLPPLFKPQLDAIRTWYQGEVGALLAVDEWVGTFVATLRATGQLDNTVILFTSDNGFFHGEHRLLFVKQRLYEAAVHVPMLARGPMFPRGAVVDSIVGNVDLAPTIVAVTGARAGITMDGRNLAALAANPSRGAGRGMLLENTTSYGAGHTEGIRTDRYKYLVNERHEEQLYDLAVDPDEVQNRASDPALADVKADLVRRTDVLRTCAGVTCEGADAR